MPGPLAATLPDVSRPPTYMCSHFNMSPALSSDLHPAQPSRLIHPRELDVNSSWTPWCKGLSRMVES